MIHQLNLRTSFFCIWKWD